MPCTKTRAEGRIEAYAAPDGAATRRAERLWLEGQSAQARPLFEKARAKAPVEARALLDKRLAAIALEADLAAGRTARLLPDKELHGWSVENGQWVVEPDGSLLGTSGSRGLMIVADARVGPSFELESDVEIVSTSNGQFQAGILFGHRPTFSLVRLGELPAQEDGARRRGRVLLAELLQAEPVRAAQGRAEEPRRDPVVGRAALGLRRRRAGGRRLPAGVGACRATPMSRSALAPTPTTTSYQVRYRGARLRRLTAEPAPPLEPAVSEAIGPAIPTFARRGPRVMLQMH